MSDKSRGRRPAGSGTREAIIQAARKQFAELGYRQTTLRSVGREADVDPRLVIHYFGTKRQLFMQAVELPTDPAALLERMVQPGPGTMGQRAAEVLIGVLEEPTTGQVVVGLVRAAATEPEAAELIRDILTERFLEPLAAHVGGRDPELRAGLMASQVVGLAMSRHVIGMEPLVRASREQLVGAIGPVFDHYLSGGWVERE